PRAPGNVAGPFVVRPSVETALVSHSTEHPPGGNPGPGTHALLEAETTRPEPPTVAEVEHWLAALLSAHRPGECVEVRAPKSSRTPRSRTCCVDNLKAVARIAREFSGKGPGVYFTLNVVRPDLPDGVAASDEDVIRLRLLLLDFDPKRPKNTNSTDAEKAAALSRARAVTAFLAARGFPAVALIDSGNGYHVLIAIDLSPEGKALVRAFLYAVAERFSDEAVDVDVTVSNPSRISKLPGTLAAKGPHSD